MLGEIPISIIFKNLPRTGRAAYIQVKVAVIFGIQPTAYRKCPRLVYYVSSEYLGKCFIAIIGKEEVLFLAGFRTAVGHKNIHEPIAIEIAPSGGSGGIARCYFNIRHFGKSSIPVVFIKKIVLPVRQIIDKNVLPAIVVKIADAMAERAAAIIDDSACGNAGELLGG